MTPTTAGPHVVIAPDKFKGTLTAHEAATAIAAGVLQVAPSARITSIPVADGGEGTIDALAAAGATEHVVTVTGPLGAPTPARYARLGGTAFVEAAQACGLQLVDPTAESALRAHSVGVGELITAALDEGVDRIVVGLGGVACTDGGSGMARALGVQLLDDSGAPVALGGGGLHAVREVDLAGLDRRIEPTRILAATDVRNPLTGPDGAARVYGPQKGAGPDEVADLERALEHYARILEGSTGRQVDDTPGAGAAGGLAAGLVAFLGATIASGCGMVLELLHVPEALAGADLVLTGEGKLDEQSLFGKAPVGVAELASRHGVPAVALAGVIDPSARERLAPQFHGLWSLVEQVGSDRAVTAPAEALTSVSRTAVRAWLGSRGQGPGV